MLVFICYELNFLIKFTNPQLGDVKTSFFYGRNCEIWNQTKLPNEIIVFIPQHRPKWLHNLLNFPSFPLWHSLARKKENLWKLAAWCALKESEQESDYYRWKSEYESVFSCSVLWILLHTTDSTFFPSRGLHIKSTMKRNRWMESLAPEKRRNYHLLRFY